jgi:hypothetical protein
MLFAFIIFLIKICTLILFLYNDFPFSQYFQTLFRGRCGHDHMVVGFATTYAISAYHH